MNYPHSFVLIYFLKNINLCNCTRQNLKKFSVNAEKSTKLIQEITLRSSTSRSSSCKSLVASNSKSASTWTEFRNDLFDDYEGMNSGSHSLTLGRLYAWEKKLYEEVKVPVCLTHFSL